MGGSVLDVLDANAAFYAAFARRDAEGVAALWSEAHPVACIHPGWDLLDGREAVLESFRAILGSPGAPEITCTHAEARLLGEAAWVTCREAIEGGAVLAATNLFVLEGGAWRLVHHQATPIAPGHARPAQRPGPAS